MLQANRQAIDEYFTHVERIALGARERGDARVLFMLDATQMDKNSPPLVYFFQRTRVYRAQYPDRLPTRNATIIHKGIIVSLADAFLKSMGDQDRDLARFFSPDERKQAVDWLLA